MRFEASPEAVARSSQSTVKAFKTGTGLSIYRDLLIPAIKAAECEIILVTCFWAPSKTLDALVEGLKVLSESQQGRTNTKIRLYIGFSSRSAAQKIFHTSSKSGRIYSSSEWTSRLGLPSQSELPGLEIEVKSLFFRPFSVLHSKYLIIDRRVAFLPSCNVSWEDWYECAVALEGPIVQDLFRLWLAVWRPTGLEEVEISTDDLKTRRNDEANNSFGQIPDGQERLLTLPSQTQQSYIQNLLNNTYQTRLLPHSYDATLRKAMWPLPEKQARQTPLNTALLQLMYNATKEIVLLTPNFTSKAVFSAVCRALSRGVRVQIITNRRMMVPEQLATAGTITEKCVDKLIKWSKRNFIKLEYLNIFYFIPANDHPGKPGAVIADKTHVKLTLVDRKAIVLGSGNMDRASWTTSQELGILIDERPKEKPVGDDSTIDESRVGNSQQEPKLEDTGDSESLAYCIWKEVEKELQGSLDQYYGS